MLWIVRFVVADNTESLQVVFSPFYTWNTKLTHETWAWNIEQIYLKSKTDISHLQVFINLIQYFSSSYHFESWVKCL